MCGICGFFHRDPACEFPGGVLDEMTDRLSHRGPDDRGTFIRSPGGLGHRRLTVLDLLSGQQPMATESGRSVLVTNGEIYNYLELKVQHLAGSELRSSGDTEVLLRLLDRLGSDALPLLNGMFAFGFWDVAGEKMLLARDPAGQKPLFYYHDAECFVFASELSALAAHPRVPLEIDPETLSHYLLFEAFPHPMTALKGVRKLEPGHFLQLDLRSWSAHVEAYWDDLPGTPASAGRERDLQAEFEATLTSAVDRHLRSDVDVGIFLSAGLDSPSLLKAAAAGRGGQNLATFTIRHELPSFDESGPARAVAEFYGTGHRERLLRESDFRADAQDLLRHVDEPVADPGMLALYQVVKFSREFVKVVLSGNGGDEFLAGYAPFRALGAYHWAHALMPPALVRTLAQLAALPRANHAYMNSWLKIQRFLRGVPTHPAELLMQWIGAFNHTEARAVLHPDLQPRSLSEKSAEFGAPLLYEALYREHARVANRDPVTQLLHMFQHFFLPNCICTHSDRASMKLSQELRSPFLDVEVMRLANRLPVSMKYRTGRTKVVLRKYLENDFPGSISRRQKQGFTIPIAAWLTSSLKPWADEVLDPQQLEKDGLFDAAQVRRLWGQHQAGQADHGKALWTVLSFQVLAAHAFRFLEKS